ncbi:YihA family ribosome biogenesis GTP-binding protein [bacterium]|nr:MAG: YihA family ribosome biogenesis GTP-binding protein [bacterium]
MRIDAVELVHYCARIEECPTRDMPEFALSGRSNVGKSSIVNLLTRKKKLAYTSKHPGKTQCLIYFEVDERWNLVDMPGYGYAKVGQQERRKWARQAEEYLSQREQLCGVMQLIDFKVGPTDDDRARLRGLASLGRPLCLVMTKADKIAKTRREAKLGEHLKALDVRLPADTAVVLTSASEGFGRNELLAWLSDRLADQSDGHSA